MMDVYEEAISSLRNQAEKATESLLKNGPRILIMGASGAGKSSVLNACFGAHVANISHCLPCTQSISYFPATERCPIHLYDTKGFETQSTNEDILRHLHDLLQQREEASQHVSSMEEQLAEKLHAVWWVMDCRLEVELEKTISNLFGDVPIFILLNKCDRSKQEVADILQNMKDQCPWARAVVPIVAEAKHGPILKVCGACNSDEILIMCTERKRFYVCQNSVCTEFEKQQGVKRSYGIEKLQEETLKCLPELVARSFRQVEMECLQDLHTRALNYIMACGALAAAAGAIPLPFSDVFLLFSIQTAMFASLAKLYDVQVCSRTTHRLVISISGLGGIGVGGKFLGTLLKFIPGIGSLLGGVCCASIASIFTIAMGLLFQKMLEGIRSRALFGEISFEHFCDMMDLQQQREFLQQKVQELRSRPTQDAPLRRTVVDEVALEVCRFRRAE